MTIDELKERYRNHHKTQLIVEHLKDKNKLQLKGAIGSSVSFIAQGVINFIPRLHLFILNDREEAAYYLNDLENLIGENQTLFFPQSYKKAHDPDEVDSANILLRAEALNRIGKSSGVLCVVTYPEALTEKVVTQKHLKQNTLELKQGEGVSIEFISDLLFEYGFDRVDYVIEPGQFSIRGGIVDIFSFANDHPYRVEFFGNEVDSLRTFDPVSQLSVAKHVKITILPNIQEKLVQESHASFLDFISDNSVIWVKDFQLCLDRIQKEYDLILETFRKHDTLIRQTPPEELYINEKEFADKASRFALVEVGNKKYFQPDHVFEYNFSPQPSFNKNFDLLIENLRTNTNAGIKNLLFADTAKQIERIYVILEDIKASHGKVFSPEEVTPVLLSFHEGFIDKDLKIACYTDHQIFDRYHRFKLKGDFKKSKQALTIKELQGLSPGDYVTHIDHGVGKFAGLEKIDVNGKMQEAIRLVYKDNDILYVSIHSLHRISKFSGQEGHVPKINKLGTNTWANLKQRTKSKVKEIAFDLIKLYAKRKAQKGFEFSPDTYLQTELEASFIYEDTPDQIKSTAAVKKDMESPYPMDRLICGDVGFGKTEIAVRAAFKAVCDSKQVAILVPTTILALQHYKTFSDRLGDFPCKVDYINRFKSAKQQKETLQKLETGESDILIGTHRLVGKDVKFKDLGLLIIDEEQKFGVAIKEKLKTLKINIDNLTLTATPIPRTLQFSMMGARDLSVITTPPPNRYPVQTELQTFNEEVIRDAVSFEIARGGQVFFIHNRVQNIQEVAGMIQRLCPDAKVLVGHGQMEGEKLEEVMLNFVDGTYDVLVATTIIESGLDIPNANTIIINQAHMFGLSDLHQMRGRVGRSNKKAFCYLLAPAVSALTNEARKRLKAIEEFADLGSGFNIAMRDLDIRGAGNILGAEQSGFISEIGFEMYMKILNEAIEELKETEFKDLFHGQEQETSFAKASFVGKTFVKDCQIDTDMEILIPDEYVTNITERLHLYKQLDELEIEEDLLQYEKNLVDRFGPVPSQVIELINTIRLRNKSRKLGFEKLILKGNKFIGYFISNQQSPFYESNIFTGVLQFVQSNPRSVKMKEIKGKLTLSFENIKSVSDALKTLEPIG